MSSTSEAVCAQLSLPARHWSWMQAEGWLKTLPVVTGISGLIQTAPSKKCFPIWVEKQIISVAAQSL